jgi:hypothetical protein
MYRYLNRKPATSRVAFAAGESTGPVAVRNAGPDEMRSDPPEWDMINQASDESYPASDPPAANHFT